MIVVKAIAHHWRAGSLEQLPLNVARQPVDATSNPSILMRVYHETAERLDVEVLDRLCSYHGCTIAELLDCQADVQGYLSSE